MGSPSSLFLTDPVAAWNKDIYELEFCATVDQRITWVGFGNSAVGWDRDRMRR